MSTPISSPYNAIKVQNESLKKNILGVRDYYSLERNQYLRKTDTLPILGYIKNGLFVIYAVVYLVLLLVFFMKGRGLSIYTKIGLVILFGLYPFFIYPFENGLYQLYFYTYSVIYGESYAKLMSQKGLQNPKNFRDVTNLGYSASGGGTYGSPRVPLP